MLNTISRDQAETLKTRRYHLAVEGAQWVPVNSVGAYIQLDAEDQLRMLKMEPGGEIDLRGEGVAVIKLRRIR